MKRTVLVGFIPVALGAVALLSGGELRAANAPAPVAAAPAAPATPNATTFAVRINGNRFVDAQGRALQLRGVNVSGLEFAHIKGFPGPEGWGEQKKPNLKAIKAWGANVIRVPLNEASYLGFTTYDWPEGGRSATTRNPDPTGRYRQIVRDLVNEAVAQGFYVILDLHWNAPNATVPGQAKPVPVAPRNDGQNEMADADYSLDFWRTLASDYRNDPAVIFELFNEPHIDNFDRPTLDWRAAPWLVLRDGGTGRIFYGGGAVIRQPWKSAGMQAMLDVVRSSGARNVVLTSGIDWAKDISRWTEFAPKDPLRQLGAVWHVYSPYNSSYGKSDYAQPARGEGGYAEAEAIMKAGYPVIITEIGDHSADGTKDSPLLQKVLPWADRNGVSALGWTWNAWGQADHNLIKDASGTPTDGYGQYFRKWLSEHR